VHWPVVSKLCFDRIDNFLLVLYCGESTGEMTPVTWGNVACDCPVKSGLYLGDVSTSRLCYTWSAIRPTYL
jgi:hypothetical protein